MKITLACKPGGRAGERWCLHIQHEKLTVLEGFATAHDAWVFAVAHFMIDPLHPQSSRMFTLKPEKVTAEQIRMF